MRNARFDPHPRWSRLAAASLTLCATTALGCALLRGTPMVPISPDGLVHVPTQRSGTLFVKPNHGFDSYDDILVSQIGIGYAEGQTPLTGSEENLIYQRLLETRTARLEARGQRVAQAPGPCTLAQSLYLTDLELFEAEFTGSQTNVVSSFGAVTVVMEFRDSLSNEVLVRYGARKGLGGGVAEGRIFPDLERLDQTLQSILEVMSDTLRRELPLGPTDARAAIGCEGWIGKARLAARQRH